MGASEQFHEILKTLKVHLRFINQNIFEQNYHRGVRYYLLLCIYVILVANYVYTFGCFKQTVSQVLMSAGYFIGHTQVKYSEAFQM